MKVIILLFLLAALSTNAVYADWFDGLGKDLENKIGIVRSADEEQTTESDVVTPTIPDIDSNIDAENDITTEDGAESNGVTKPTDDPDTSEVTEPTTAETSDTTDEESSTEGTETTEEPASTESTDEPASTETTEEPSTEETTETTEESSTDETTEEPITTDAPPSIYPTRFCPDVGFYPLPSSCVNYTYCAYITGEMKNFTLSCPQGQSYNYKTKFCEDSFNCTTGTTTEQSSTTEESSTTDEPASTEAPPTFDCPDEGFYPQAGSCVQFAYCADVAGEVKYFPLSCPEGQQFNYNSNLCEKNFDCQNL